MIFISTALNSLAFYISPALSYIIVCCTTSFSLLISIDVVKIHRNGKKPLKNRSRFECVPAMQNAMSGRQAVDEFDPIVRHSNARKPQAAFISNNICTSVMQSLSLRYSTLMFILLQVNQANICCCFFFIFLDFIQILFKKGNCLLLMVERAELI